MSSLSSGPQGPRCILKKRARRDPDMRGVSHPVSRRGPAQPVLELQRPNRGVRRVTICLATDGLRPYQLPLGRIGHDTG